jgi:hypothetical protein
VIVGAHSNGEGLEASSVDSNRLHHVLVKLLWAGVFEQLVAGRMKQVLAVQPVNNGHLRALANNAVKMIIRNYNKNK